MKILPATRPQSGYISLPDRVWRVAGSVVECSQSATTRTTTQGKIKSSNTLYVLQNTALGIN